MSKVNHYGDFTLKRIVMSSLIFTFLLSFLMYLFVLEKKVPTKKGAQCTIVDNDGSFDDLRSLIFLGCSHQVNPTHLVFTEGVVEPKESLHNYRFLAEKHQLRNQGLDLSLGEKSNRKLSDRWLKVRERDRLINNYFASTRKLNTNMMKQEAIGDLASLTSRCSEIDLLILGPYTSVVGYWEKIAQKVSRVVTMGGSEENFFNCWYDQKSCKNFFSLVPKDILYSISVEQGNEFSNFYTFDRKFVETLTDSPILRLWRDIFLANSAGWEPRDVLMWDDLTSFFFVDKSKFKKSTDYWIPRQNPSFYRDEWRNLIENCRGGNRDASI